MVYLSLHAFRIHFLMNSDILANLGSKMDVWHAAERPSCYVRI